MEKGYPAEIRTLIFDKLLRSVAIKNIKDSDFKSAFIKDANNKKYVVLNTDIINDGYYKTINATASKVKSVKDALLIQKIVLKNAHINEKKRKSCQFEPLKTTKYTRKSNIISKPSKIKK